MANFISSMVLTISTTVRIVAVTAAIISTLAHPGTQGIASVPPEDQAAPNQQKEIAAVDHSSNAPVPTQTPSEPLPSTATKGKRKLPTNFTHSVTSPQPPRMFQPQYKFARYRDTRTCFRCGEVGHIARGCQSCPMKRTRFSNVEEEQVQLGTYVEKPPQKKREQDDYKILGARSAKKEPREIAVATLEDSGTLSRLYDTLLAAGKTTILRENWSLVTQLSKHETFVSEVLLPNSHLIDIFLYDAQVLNALLLSPGIIDALTKAHGVTPPKLPQAACKSASTNSTKEGPPGLTCMKIKEEPK